MPNDQRDADAESAREQAAAWLVRRDAVAPSATEQADFDAWLVADAAHRAAYAEVQRLWSEMDEAAVAIAPVRPDTADAAARAVPAPSPRPRRRTRRVMAGSLAAGMLLFAVLAGDPVVRLQADAVAAIGATRTVPLSDGSTAVLNTASAIAIDYDGRERRIRLLRGEAEFQVAADAARPFVVDTGDATATALGTVFHVDRRSDGVTVSLLEGRVAVRHDGTGAADETVLSPGQRVTYAPAHGFGPVTAVDATAATAWKRGKLIFHDRPLGEVIDKLNRYHVGMIRILDGALRNRKVNGVFETREPAAAVTALERSLGIDSIRLSDFVILLHR